MLWSILVYWSQPCATAHVFTALHMISSTHFLSNQGGFWATRKPLSYATVSYVYEIQHWQVTIFYLKIVDCNFFNYVEIRCPPPTQPGNGTVNVTSNTVDGIALFYCLPTHYLDGSYRRVCTESGEWNGTQPRCVGQWKSVWKSL